MFRPIGYGYGNGDGDSNGYGTVQAIKSLNKRSKT